MAAEPGPVDACEPGVHDLAEWREHLDGAEEAERARERGEPPPEIPEQDVLFGGVPVPVNLEPERPRWWDGRAYKAAFDPEPESVAPIPLRMWDWTTFAPFPEPQPVAVVPSARRSRPPVRSRSPRQRRTRAGQGRAGPSGPRKPADDPAPLAAAGATR